MPVHNFDSFNLHVDINKAITSCGYTDPTPVQAKSIPEVMAGKDVVVSAQTGTGKTASFVLPALHSLSEQPLTKKTRILILTPTRELAAQITKAAGLYGKFMRFNIVSLVGGMPYHNQIKDLARGADIIVATPGRLMDHIEQKRVDLSNVSMLVLDEADRMLDMGFIDDVQYIAKLTPSKRQTLLFSATLDNKLMNAVKHLLNKPVRIDLSHEKMSAPKIKQEMYKVSNLHHKNRLLKHFLNDENIYKAIIFSATKINADKLAAELCDYGFAAAALHGDLRQNVRNRTLEQLRRGKVQFLVATDVAARGIDISDITHVFNYDLPRFCEDYVHRIGRTGRAGKEGTAISFVSPSDSKHLNSIERYIGQRIKLIQNVETIETGKSTRSDSFAFKNDDDSDDNFKSRKRNSFSKDKREGGDRFKSKNHNSDRDSRFDRDSKPRKRFSSNESRDSRDRDSRKRDNRDRDNRDSKKRFDRNDRDARSTSGDNNSRFKDNKKRFDRDDRDTRSTSGDNNFRFKDNKKRFDRDDRFASGDSKPAFKDKNKRFGNKKSESTFKNKNESNFKVSRKPKSRVEFKDSNRKSDGEGKQVKVEFKESGRKPVRDYVKKSIRKDKHA